MTTAENAAAAENPAPAPALRWGRHLLWLSLLVLVLTVVFLQEPGFGDDFTYWNFAFRLHEHGLSAWLKGSFHDLRWPVWGICWALQGIVGQGLLSFYGQPAFYLAAGSALAFTFGRLVSNSLRIAWACGLVFFFQPLLDTVSYRPMPDLSEGVWGAVAMLCWWKMVTATESKKSALFAALLGLSIFIAEANRITGVFIVPILVLCTVIWARRHIRWLAAAGLVAAICYGLEAAFYHHLFADWVHDIHANLGGKGHRGTGSIPMWQLPTRFLGSLWKGGHLAHVYCILAIIGLVAVAPRRRPSRTETSATPDDATHPLGSAVLAQALGLWLVALYLEYACAPQSLHPWRPLIRDADRFLCGMLVPMSVLIILGAAFLLELPYARKAKPWLVRVPLITGLLGLAFLVEGTWRARGLFSLGYVPEMSAYMRSRPAGCRIFTHESMRGLAFLVDAKAARQLTWLAPGELLRRQESAEKMADTADEFWYARKLVWLGVRKDFERKVESDAQRASYFEHPEQKWMLSRLMAKGAGTPDLVFYRRRLPSDPSPRVLGPDAPEFAGLLPKLPVEWTGTREDQYQEVEWPVPPSLRGQFVRVELEAASKEVEPMHIQLHFKQGDKELTAYHLNPYLSPKPGAEFFPLQIPAASDHCEIILKLFRKSPTVQVSGLRVVAEQAPSPATPVSEDTSVPKPDDDETR